MPQMRIAQAARLLGVSDDTVRRWVDAGQLGASVDGAGRKVLDGAELAAFARTQAAAAPDPSDVGRSARNRFVGLVTDVQLDGLVAQVELQCGPHRVVSLMTAEAARELGLVPGVVAVAVIKATQVVVETP
jgi:molybdopterin-binding protein